MVKSKSDDQENSQKIIESGSVIDIKWKIFILKH